MDNLIDIGEVARMLGVKVSTIYAWVSQGLIPHIKLNRLVRFSRGEVVEWVQSHRIRGRKSSLPEKDPLYIASG